MPRSLKFKTQMTRWQRKLQEAEYKKLRVKRLGYIMRNTRFPWENTFLKLCRILGHEP